MGSVSGESIGTTFITQTFNFKALSAAANLNTRENAKSIIFDKVDYFIIKSVSIHKKKGLLS